MGNVIQAQANLPAAFAAVANTAYNEFAGGVTAGFPVVSFRGKVWRLRKGGDETNFIDASGNPQPSINVVLLRGNEHPSKSYYANAYQEGANEAPDCWATNGLTPDPEVPSPFSNQCATCPNNVWGSAMTPAGKKTRACSDVRRIAVLFESNLVEAGAAATPALLRIPPASLTSLKEYVEKALAPRGIPPFALVTTINFDVGASHPRLVFRPLRLATDVEAADIMALRDAPETLQILNAGQEFLDVAAPENTATAPTAAPQPAATRPTAPTARRLQPVQEEDFEDDGPTAPPAPAPQVDDLADSMDALLNDAGASAPPAAAAQAPRASKPASRPRAPRAPRAPRTTAPAPQAARAPAPATPAPQAAATTATQGGGSTDVQAALDALLNGL